MTLLKKLFNKKRLNAFRNAKILDWEQLPTISAITLLDKDAFTRAPAILHGMLGLRNVLIDAAKTLFHEDESNTISELVARKCQLLAVADIYAGLSVDRLGPATQKLCSDHGFDLFDFDSEAHGRSFGIPLLYSSAISEAWGEWHVVIDANLTKEHWNRIFALIPKEIDAPARMAFGKSVYGQYVVAVLHRAVVSANDLISIDAGPSFNDFCIGAAERMKEAKVKFDVVGLGEVLGQRSREH